MSTDAFPAFGEKAKDRWCWVAPSTCDRHLISALGEVMKLEDIGP